MIKLEQNYRSTANILNAANDVIRNNAGRKDKRLWTENGDGALRSISASSRTASRKRSTIIGNIRSHIEKEEAEYKDHARSSTGRTPSPVFSRKS